MFPVTRAWVFEESRQIKTGAAFKTNWSSIPLVDKKGIPFFIWADFGYNSLFSGRPCDPVARLFEEDRYL
jgi:hypothetical protein